MNKYSDIEGGAAQVQNTEQTYPVAPPVRGPEHADYHITAARAEFPILVLS
jgi:hypothetical protein